MLWGSWHAGTVCVQLPCSSVSALLFSFLPEGSSMTSGCNGSTGEEVRETGCLVFESSEVLGAMGRRAGMAGQDRLVVVGGRGAGGALMVGLEVLMVAIFSLEGIEGREAEFGLVAGALALLWTM